MKVCLIQMNSQDDKAENLLQAEELLVTAIESTAPDLVSLPELFTYLGGTAEGAKESAETIPGGEAYRLLRQTAMKYRVFVHGGSINERDGDSVFNTTLVFDPSGDIVTRYRKIHLFDVVTPDGKVYRESATFARGHDVVSGSLGETVFGCTICYDLRFPELYTALSNAGAQIIFVPSAFTLMTGTDHWEALCRARAIETQCYLLAANQCGSYTEDGVARESFGNSMIVDPWGTVISRCQNKVGFCSTTLDFEYLEKIRSDLPALRHRVLGR